MSLQHLVGGREPRVLGWAERVRLASETRRDHPMSTIHSARKTPVRELTVADLQRRFGPIPFGRIRQNPPPGSGTVADVIRLSDHEDRLYELVDGILVEKV